MHLNPTPVPPPPLRVAAAPPRPAAETHGTRSTSRPPSTPPQILGSLPAPSGLTSGLRARPCRRACGERQPLSGCGLLVLPSSPPRQHFPFAVRDAAAGPSGRRGAQRRRPRVSRARVVLGSGPSPGAPRPSHLGSPLLPEPPGSQPSRGAAPILA